MQEFEHLFIYFILSLIFALCMLILSFIVSPKSTNTSKEAYECGNKPIGVNRIKFNVQFFVYALLFLIFDIETLFIFPFALCFDMTGGFVFAEISIFIGLLLLGLIYAIKKNLLRFEK